jgi:hypothetical protein
LEIGCPLKLYLDDQEKSRVTDLWAFSIIKMSAIDSLPWLNMLILILMHQPVKLYLDSDLSWLLDDAVWS